MKADRSKLEVRIELKVKGVEVIDKVKEQKVSIGEVRFRKILLVLV
jgi:hypothetical protein